MCFFTSSERLGNKLNQEKRMAGKGLQSRSRIESNKRSQINMDSEPGKRPRLDSDSGSEFSGGLSSPEDEDEDQIAPRPGKTGLLITVNRTFKG